MKKWIPAAATAAGAYLIAIAPRLCERPERMPKVYYAHRGQTRLKIPLQPSKKRWMQAMALSWMCR